VAEPTAERADLPVLGQLARPRKLFSTPPGRRRYRRATDVFLLVPALLALGVLVVAYPPSRFERALAVFVGSFPDWLEPVWETLYGALVVWAVLGLLAAVVTRRLQLVLAAAGAALGALALAALATWLAGAGWPPAGADGPLWLRTGESGFTVLGLAAFAAVALVVGPYLVRPLQRFGHWVVVLGVFGALLAQVASPSATLASFVIALAAATAVRLALGTSAGHPETEAVVASLAELGVAVDALQPAARQPAGVFVARGVDTSGAPLLVKVYGRDAYDTQLLEKAWRTVFYSDDGPRARLSRLEAAEHEALVTLLAAQAGVHVPGVLIAAESSAGDALLVLRDARQPLDGLPADRLADALLAEAWGVVRALGDARIAHHRIGPDTLMLLDGRVGIVELDRATVAARDDQLRRDEAQLLGTTAALAGVDRAVAAARSALGDAALAELLPFVQPAAFGPSLRRALKTAEVDVDDLRAAAAEAVGLEAPELVRLRRVTWGTAIQVALLTLAITTLIGAASGLDFEELRTTLDDALWGWVVLGFLVAQLPRFAQAVSTLGSVPTRLPFLPVYAMQLATGYMNLALPSTFARMAINIRFFQRQGVPPATAVTSGAIDSLVSTVAQAMLLVLLLLFSSATLDFDLGSPSGPPTRALVAVVVLAALLLGVALAVRRVRAGIRERIGRWWPEVKATLANLRAGNKLGLLVGGSVAAEVLFAIALGTFAYAMGSEIALAQLLLINISVSLLASFVPVPGGIGVQEFGLTLGLTAAGMSEEAALAAVLLYRAATFYLPPLWGFVAMRWLQRNGSL
jgi:uncharacterized membrane protein YbhN (UPF0104 family)